jgi:glycosyltransferase involved in cell wall biosynthesis
MRVVYVSDYGGPYAGAFIPMLRSAIRAVQAQGWTADAVFTPVARDRPWQSQIEAEGVTPRFTPAGTRAAVRDWLADVVAESDEPTIVHSQHNGLDLPAVAAARRRPRATVIWHLRSPFPPGARAWLRSTAKYVVYGRHVAAFLCVAPNIPEQIGRRLGRRSRARFFPNGLDVEWLTRNPYERGTVRRELGLPEEAAVLLHFGWDWPRKGGELYLRAVAELGALERPLVALTVGAPPEAQRLIRELGLAERARAIPPADDARYLYAASDVLVTPSTREGMTLGMVEALASGLAVVASDIPGQAAVGPGLGARRLVPLQADAIAGAIGELLARSPMQIRAESEAARAWVREHMDLDAWSERLMRVYEDVRPDAR